jgi:hypothetical protein
MKNKIVFIVLFIIIVGLNNIFAQTNSVQYNIHEYFLETPVYNCSEKTAKGNSSGKTFKEIKKMMLLK